LCFFVAFGVAIERAFEISKSNNESGPATNEAELEDIVLDKRPCTVTERAYHRYALVRELASAERRVAVHLVDHFLQIAERKLPDRILQSSHRPRAKYFESLVDRLERVANTAFVEELGLAEIRIPVMARLRRSPNPLKGTFTTRAPSDRATSAVRSVLNESTTTTSSAHNRLDTAASIFSDSL